MRALGLLPGWFEGGAPTGRIRDRIPPLISVRKPNAFLELSSEALGMSWFVYHTQLIPQLYDAPWLVPDTLQRALEDSDLPPLQLLIAERKTFQLDGGLLDTFGEHRLVRLDDARPR